MTAAHQPLVLTSAPIVKPIMPNSIGILSWKPSYFCSAAASAPPAPSAPRLMRCAPPSLLQRGNIGLIARRGDQGVKGIACLRYSEIIGRLVDDL